MAPNPLNFFEPYPSLPPGHENQLTRALVVVLKLSPMAHATWLRRVDPGLELHRMPTVDWRVQRRDVVPAKAAEAEGLRVISVFVSGEREEPNYRVEETDRLAVFDAIAVYGTELAIVVEVKVTAKPSVRQAESLNLGGFTVKLDPQVRAIPWRAILGDVGDLLSHELVAGAEAGVLEDFLEYTEEFFPDLQPFSQLRLCHDDTRRRRRLRVILTEASGVPARPGPAPSIPLVGAISVDRAYLDLRGTEVRLSLYAADTLTQAQALYTQPDVLEGLLGLRDSGWTLMPNFHWGHMAKGLAWASTPLGVDEYIDLWTREIDNTHPVKRADWNRYWEWLDAHQLADTDGRNHFRVDFEDTKRQSATPRPGLQLHRSWSLAEAEDLDDGGDRFNTVVREGLAEAIAALHEHIELRPGKD